MCRFLWAFLFVFMLMGRGFADLVQCVDLNQDVVCTAGADAECYNVSDCAIKCSGKDVLLASRCSNQSGTPDVSSAINVTVSDEHSENMYCWCMVVTPVVSKWVMRYAYSSGGVCATYCARGCSNGFLFDTDVDRTYRATVFNNLAE